MSASTAPPACRRRARDWLRALATYDLFPAFSARARRLLYNPLGVLALAALTALLCGLFLHPQGLVLFAGVMAVIVLGVAWPWLSVRGVRGTIVFARRRTTEEESGEVCLTLRNRLPWSAWGLAVRDPAAPAVTIASAPGRQTVHCRWSFVPPCRGVYPITPLRLGTGFPFGLWESGRPLAVEAPLIVWPRTLPVGPVPAVGGDEQAEGTSSRHKVGSSGDVLGVRPYRRGDSPRRIHWGQSARHDRLIVCELQANTRAIVQFILDADPGAHAGAGPDGSREWAIRIVASLAKGWLHAGAQVAAVWDGESLPAASGPRQLHRLLDGLARIRDSAGASLAQVMAGPACRGFRAGLQVIVTTDEALLAAGRSLPRHERQRWVVLRAAAFRESSEEGARPPAGLPVVPWLWVDAIRRIPALLHGGWKEARHGS